MQIIQQKVNIYFKHFNINTNPEKFVFIAFLVFKLLSGREFVYKQKRQ